MSSIDKPEQTPVVNLMKQVSKMLGALEDVDVKIGDSLFITNRKWSTLDLNQKSDVVELLVKEGFSQPYQQFDKHVAFSRRSDV